MRRLFKQFSFPGGVPSHVAAEMPGLDPRGRRARLRALARVRRGVRQPGPGRRVRDRRRRGRDRPARRELALEQVPRPGARRRGAADPAPQRLQDLQPVGAGADRARASSRACWSATAGSPTSSRARTRSSSTGRWPRRSTARSTRSPRSRREARASGISHRPRWPMIVLRTPKGWTGPKEVDGLKTEDHSRSHQVPLAALASRPDHLEALEAWMRSYRPEELFDADGRLVPELRALAPEGDRRMGANPHANGGKLLRSLRMPDFRDFAVDVPAPGAATAEATKVLGGFLHDVMRRNLAERNFRLFAPDENASNRLQARLRDDRQDVAGARAARRRGPRRRRARDGDPLRAHLPGLARGLPADRPARAVLVLRGVHPHRRLDVQPAREVAQDHARARLAARRSRR